MNKLWMAVALMIAGPASAQVVDTPRPDTSRWKCSKCITYEGWVGSVDFGVLAVSEESTDFGRYNGLDDNGAYLDLGSDLAYYGESGQVWQVRARDLGIDQRRVLIDGGTQGTYRFRLEYDESLQLGADGTSTPYRGNGSDSLDLPAGWVRAGSTAGMTSLNGALRPIDLLVERDVLAVGVDLVASAELEYSFDYRREHRDGLRAFSSGMLFNAVQFAAPVDSVTDTLTASLSYTGDEWAATFSYLGSFYANDATEVQWDNPYSSPFGADSGQNALSPDNTFHQLSASANFRLSQQTGVYANVAIGQGSQNDDFLPYTTNSTLGVAALPRSDLAGRVDTVTAVARLTSRPSEPWRLKAQFRFDDRYNKSAQASYNYVITDSLVSTTSQTNLPYGFKDRDLGLEAEYRFDPGTRLAVGLDRESRERTFQAVEQTDETGLWAKGSYRLGDATDVSLKVVSSVRDATASAAPPAITSTDNPLLRKYNTADRGREEARLRLSSQATEDLAIGVDLGYSRDDYDDTELGLTDAKMRDRGLDMNYRFADDWNLYAAYSLQKILSAQIGNEGGTTNWRINEEDAVETISVGVSYAPPKTTMRLGVDLTQSVSLAHVALTNGGIRSDFPRLTMAFEQARVYGVYPWSRSLDVTAGLTYELGNADDWALDGVDPGTVNNVLSLGGESIDYKVWVVGVGLRFRLDPVSE